VPTPVLSELGPIDWDAQVATVKQQVLARLAHHGVELSPQEIRVEEVWTPAEWGRRFGLHDGSAFGASHGLFQLGPFRPANANAEVGGLYYAGASTVPGTGMPMVVLSGRLAAERVLSEGS
jgi:phytoene desaturase